MRALVPSRVPTIGQAAKMAADRMTQNNMRELIHIIRAGGSRAATQAPPNVAQRAIQAGRDDFIRAIMAGGLNRAEVP